MALERLKGLSIGWIYVVIKVSIISSFSAAVCSQRVSALTELESITTGNQVVISQSGAASKLVVKGFDGDRVYATPTVRGLVAFSVFESSAMAHSEQLTLISSYKSKLGDLQIRFSVSTEDAQNYSLVEKASYLWAKNNSKDWTKASELLAEVLYQLPLESSGHELIVKFYVEALLELQHYDLLRELSDVSFVRPYENRFWYQYALVKGLDGKAVPDIRNQFKELYLRYKDHNDLNDYQKLDFSEATASYARSIFIEQFNGVDKQDMAYGKRLLDESIEVCERFEAPLCKSHVLNAVSIFYWLERRYAEGENALKEALKYARTSKDNRQIASILNNLAFSYEWQGKKVFALTALTEAFSLEDSLPANSASGIVAINLAKNYLALGTYELANTYLNSAIESFQGVENEIDYALVSLMLSESLFELGYFEKARIAAESALEIFELSPDLQASNILKTLNQLAILDLETGDGEPAKGYYKKSRAIFDKKNSNDAVFTPEKVSTLLEYLKILSRTRQEKEFSEVSTSLASVLDQLDNEYGIEFQKAEYYKTLAQDALLKADYSSCLNYAKRSQKYLQIIRSSLEYSFKGVGWNRKTSEVESLILEALMNLASTSNKEAKQWDDFFSLIFDSQSRVLRLSRAQVSAYEENTLNDEELQNISALESAASKTSEKHFRNNLLLQIANLREYYLQYKYHSGVKKIDASKSNLNIDKLQNELEDSEVILSFYIKHGLSFLIQVSKEAWQIEMLPIEKELAISINSITEVLSNRGSISQLSESSLYEMLRLDSIIDSGTKKLYVVTDGPLVNFPFEVLHKGGEAYNPIGDSMEVVYPHSLNDYFQVDKEVNQSLRPDIFVFADPIFRTEEEFQQRLAHVELNDIDRQWSYGLQRLTWTEKEAESIVETFIGYDVQIALAEKAQSEALLSKQALNSKILHIATHGYFDAKTPHLMGIATTPTTRDAGFVSLTRLYSKKVDSNLVVISACETSVGPVIGNEGSVGLSYGFLSRGAGSVIGTAWKIPDRASSLFMTKFYQNLLEFKGNSSKALQATKRSFIRSGRYKHPFFWSSFMLFSTSKLVDTDVFDERGSNLY